MAKPNAKAKLGEGGRFAALKQKLGKREGITNPGALAAYIGRKKYGASKFAKLGAAGRRSAHGSGPFSKAEIDKGYKLVSAPAYVSALTTAEHEGGAEQKVKGKDLKRTSEAKQVAGR